MTNYPSDIANILSKFKTERSKGQKILATSDSHGLLKTEEKKQARNTEATVNVTFQVVLGGQSVSMLHSILVWVVRWTTCRVEAHERQYAALGDLFRSMLCSAE